LRKKGVKVDALHGDKSQNVRSKVLSKFKQDKINVLIATDVAARGLDVPDILMLLTMMSPLTTRIIFIGLVERDELVKKALL